MAESILEVRVKRIGYEAENINSYELVAPTGGELAPFTAGGHIDLHLSNGMILTVLKNVPPQAAPPRRRSGRWACAASLSTHKS